MKIRKRTEGQTLIETALVLSLLLLIVFGITEFARAWYTKNSLKNAARHGSRTAVVTSNATTAVCPLGAGGQITCPQNRTFTPCPGSGIVNAVCTSPGISPNAQVSICYKDEAGGTTGKLDQGDTINVCGATNFTFVIGGSPWPWPASTTFTADASMRYEL